LEKKVCFLRKNRGSIPRPKQRGSIREHKTTRINPARGEEWGCPNNGNNEVVKTRNKKQKVENSCGEENEEDSMAGIPEIKHRPFVLFCQGPM
jgi:hypothetical protein